MTAPFSVLTIGRSINMGNSIIGKATGEIKDKLSKGQTVSPADRKAAAMASFLLSVAFLFSGIGGPLQLSDAIPIRSN